MTKDNLSHAALPQQKTLSLLKRLIKNYVAPYKGLMVVALLSMAVAALMTASIAKLMQPVLDDVINGKSEGMIVPVAAAFFVAFVVRGISSYVAVITTNKVTQFMIGDIQKHLFSHFMSMDLTYFHANPSGQLMSLIVNDVNILRGMVSDALMGVGKSLLTLIFLICLMFYLDYKLATAALFVFPVAAIFVAYLGKKIRKVSKALQGDVATLSDKLSKIFQGIRVVKAYAMENYEKQRAGEAITAVRQLNIKAIRIGQLSTPVNECLVGALLFGIIIYGGYQASAGLMTAGQLGAFLTAFIMAYEPMKKLARLNNSIQLGLGAAERIFANIDTAPDIKDKPDAKLLSVKSANIYFDQVGFHYEGSDKQALQSISFEAKAGEVTALVGPSGGGKSTILNMIPRFYDVDAGQVRIDNDDIRDVTMESLRTHIALVSQDITIFDATIAENIAYGKEGASQTEIEAAARAAAAHDFISAMSEGYNTQVGEDGIKLSGGQRQRISIARAILKDAPILLLDEATSALDNESERVVQEALKALEKGRTTLVIAHRLSTVQEAQQILVIDDGKIVERGNHESLIKNSKLYKHMYEAGLKQ